MTEYALGHDRIIGMIRPRDDDDVHPSLYGVGCAGRITSFAETGDGRYLLELTGLSRFKLDDETLADSGFRLGTVDWSAYGVDLHETPSEPPALRERVIDRLMTYLSHVGLTADWETVEGASAETLVNSVSMSCPFEPDEKQALLEAPSLFERAETLIALMEIAVADAGGEDQNGRKSRIQ